MLKTKLDTNAGKDAARAEGEGQKRGEHVVHLSPKRGLRTKTQIKKAPEAA